MFRVMENERSPVTKSFPMLKMRVSLVVCWSKNQFCPKLTKMKIQSRTTSLSSNRLRKMKRENWKMKKERLLEVELFKNLIYQNRIQSKIKKKKKILNSQLPSLTWLGKTHQLLSSRSIKKMISVWMIWISGLSLAQLISKKVTRANKRQRLHLKIQMKWIQREEEVTSHKTDAMRASNSESSLYKQMIARQPLV